MRATLPLIKERFNHLNALCFEGKLPVVDMRISHGWRFLGKLEYRRNYSIWGKLKSCDGFIIRISDRRDLTPDELDDIILHEMIHLHIAVNMIRDRSAHGPVFRSMMNDINTRYDRHIGISRKSRDDEYATDSAPRERIICVSEMADGNIGITVCARTRIARIRRMLPRLYNIKKMEWYRSSDALFRKFPRSNTPRIYRVGREELSKALQNSIRTDAPV